VGGDLAVLPLGVRPRAISNAASIARSRKIHASCAGAITTLIADALLWIVLYLIVCVDLSSLSARLKNGPKT